MDRKLLAMWGATLVAVLEALALWKEIDGAILSLAFTVIGGLCGYSVLPRVKRRRR